MRHHSSQDMLCWEMAAILLNRPNAIVGNFL
jgi:hypothetical protein